MQYFDLTQILKNIKSIYKRKKEKKDYCERDHCYLVIIEASRKESNSNNCFRFQMVAVVSVIRGLLQQSTVTQTTRYTKQLSAK